MLISLLQINSRDLRSWFAYYRHPEEFRKRTSAMSNSIVRLLSSFRIWSWSARSRRSFPRILMAVPDPATFALVDRLLRAEFGIIERVCDGFTLVREAAEHSPDLIVADFETPGVDGIEAAARLSSLKKSTPVVILATQPAHEFVEEAFEAGAAAYVLHCDARDELLLAVRSALQGRYYVSRSCR
jgi:CheY-like chemotaxis protein